MTVRRERGPVHLLGLLGEVVRRWKALTVLAVVLGMLGAGFFVDVLLDVQTGRAQAGDVLLLRRASSLAHGPSGRYLTPLAVLLSALGNWQGLIPLALALLWMASRRLVSWSAFRFFVTACVGGGILVLFFKFLIARPRPQVVPSLEETTFASFPSGHALYSLVAYGFVAFLVAVHTRLSYGKKVLVGVAALLLIVLIGASRVYLASHYPSDVAAGYLIGLPWLMLVLLAYERRRLAQPAAVAGSDDEVPPEARSSTPA